MKQFVLLSVFASLWFNLTAQNITKELKSNWKFRQLEKGVWFKATVPGTVHTDLLNNKLIPDPFYRDNESRLQWVGQEDWEYSTSFNVDEATLNKQHIELLFEGLDTYAEVYLNNQLIVSADNMFRTWKANVKVLITKENNQLHIIFRSADKAADSLSRSYPLKHPSESPRNFTRKAQYHFGWDFAPKLVTCGIWRKIKLEAWDYVSNEEIKKIVDTTIHKKQKNAVALVQEKDSIGQSFYFTINGKPTFIKGANWVPADMFLPRVTKTKYRNLLLAAKEAGINMLRVWGGGVYEDDAFYDLCDSLNIMVWQDFMFAGAMYPTDAYFLENIKQEVIDNLKRLSPHKCIAVWCGNNEIDEAWHNWGWQKQFNLSPTDSAKLWDGYKKLFHELLPSLVKQYSKQPYISTSPLNGWGKKESMTHGDSHYWGVWWGLEPITKYKEKIPRFMSEYGMQSLPSMETIQQFALPADFDTASVVMKTHQKHPMGYRNLAVYLKQNNLTATNFPQYILATQTLQSMALETAITAHINAQPRCMGTVFWQFNECWPGASWSVVDYYGRKKKAYFTVKKLFSQEVGKTERK
jgi:beta-mannosidase